MQKPPDSLRSLPPEGVSVPSQRPCGTDMNEPATAPVVARPGDSPHARDGQAPAAMNLVQLTLAAPRHLEEDLVDQLLAHPDWAAGFTLIRAEGHSHRAEALTAQERVRGRAERISLQIVLEPAQAQALLTHLKHCLPKRDVAYWLTPVIEFGRLA